MTPGAATPATIAGIAREIYTRGPVLTRVLQHWRAYICPLELIIEEVPPGSFVLDAGCGGGLLLGAMARMRHIRGGVGFDFNRDGIETATAMTRKLDAGAELRFFRLTATDAWPQGPFGVVTLVDVLHHVPPASQREVFHKAADAVEPGARLVYKDMCVAPKWRAWANTAHDLVLSRQWVHYVPMAAIREWAAAEGLTHLRSYRADRLWYGHEFAVFERAID